MKIINRTDWCTRDLSWIIRRIVRHRLGVYGKVPGRINILTVTIKYKRRNGSTLGTATLGSANHLRLSMVLYLPRGFVRIGHTWFPRHVDVAQLCSTIRHECDHLRGLSHRDMILHWPPHHFPWARGRNIRWCGAVPEEKQAADVYRPPDGQYGVDIAARRDVT